jgi:uncharacterized protein
MALYLTFFKTILLLSILVISGCTGVSSPAKYYLLEPTELSVSEQDTGLSIMQIALAPVNTPGYVNRPQIVTSLGNSQYQFSEVHRWAEPLAKNLTRVLKRYLSVLVPADVAIVRAASLAKQATYYLTVEILDIYMNDEDEVILNAHWNVYQNGQKTGSHRNNCLMTVPEDNYSGMVVALNHCYGKLSINIANSIRHTENQSVLQSSEEPSFKH